MHDDDDDDDAQEDMITEEVIRWNEHKNENEINTLRLGSAGRLGDL